jgi:PKD repeat protein
MRLALAAVLSFLLLAQPLSAECGKNPESSTFYVNYECDYTHPCLEDQSNALHISVDTSCYPSWKPCADFTFSSCDTVAWDFGDGTSAMVQGSGSVAHVWTNPGLYHVLGTISNDTGQHITGMDMIVVRKPAAYVHWSTDLFTAGEKDGELTLTLTRDGDLTRDVNVLFCAGTGAAAGETWDRNLEHTWDRPVTIPAGASSVPVKLKIRDDNTYRGEARYDVFVYDNSGETVMPTANTIAHTEVRIIDDETGPTLTVGDITVDEGDEGSQTISIPHVLSQPLDSDVMLWWQIGQGTASRGVDWNTMDGGNYYIEQYIPAGQTSTDLHIRILGDRQAEEDETIVIKLANPMHAPVAFNQPEVTVTIKDDDLYDLTPGQTEVNVGTAVPMTVGLTKVQPFATVAQLQSSEATVIQVPPSVTIPAGQREATFDAQTLRPGVATVTATFDDGHSVDATIVAALRTSLDLWFPSERVIRGGKSHGNLTTDPPVSTTVSLDVLPAGIINIPATITLGADGTAVFDIDAIKTGTATVYATLPPEYGGGAKAIPLTVVSDLGLHVAGVTPPFGPASGGTTVTVTGTDFLSDACVILIDSIEAPARRRDASTLVAVTPRHVAATVSVGVRCEGKTTTVENAFRYTPTKRRAIR